MNQNLAIVFIGLLIFAAHLFTEIFSRKRIPDVLLLMIIGLVIGPVLHWVSPEMMGAMGSVFTTITLVILLFESGTQLNFETLMKSIKGTMKLTTVNFFLTMVVVAVLGMLLAKLDIWTSLMLGAILGGTSSAVIIPMVSQLKIGSKSQTILILESAFSDVLCIVFALALLQVVESGSMNLGLVLGKVLYSFIIAAFIGIVSAILWSYVLDKVRHVKNSILTTPAFVFIVYGISDFGDRIYTKILIKMLHTEPTKLNETEKQLFSEVVFLLKTFFFVYIGISIQLDHLWPILIGLIITVVLFALRIPIVKISIWKKDDIEPFDKAFMAGMVPKGLAAAVLATMPAQAGVPGGEIIQSIVFAVILFSIVFTSIMVPILDRENAISRFYQKRFVRRKETLGERIEEKVENKLEKIIDNE